MIRIALIFAACTLVGCSRDQLFDQTVTFKDRNWKITQPVDLEFSVQNVNPAHEIACTIRNSVEYPYARIFVKYTLFDSAGSELSKKMVNTFLFDQKTGKPNGQGGLGDVYDHRVALIPNFQFTYPGRYRVRLEQVMRDDTLKGVLAVGLQVRTLESKAP